MLETNVRVNYDYDMYKTEKKDIELIPIDNIRPNPYQPRKSFNHSALQELAESISQYGVLQPINVRKINNSIYELVAGERRLKASRIANLKYIPAIIVKATENDSAIIALIENIQRENLTFLEEADSYSSLLSEHGLTQEELARKIGKSQSTVANKVRLLKLSPLVRKIISDNFLTERHARALLKLQDEQDQLAILKLVCENNYNVKKTEELIDKIINKIPSNNNFYKAVMGQTYSPHVGKVKRVIKDIRIFINTINEAVKIMKDSGVIAKAAQYDRDDYFEFIIRIPKKDNLLDMNKI